MKVLKIKEGIELKELEKYGFEEITVWGDKGWACDFTPYTKVKSSFLVIHSASREVILDYVDACDNVRLVHLMFDLIKDGIIEMVDEVEV